MSSFLRWYQAKLAARPLLTQSATTAVLFAVGDITAQQVVEKRGFDKHEFARTGRMFAYGGAIFGPAATTWYKLLSQRVVLPGRPRAEMVARVACDQLLFAPTFIGVFLSSMALMEGGAPRDKLASAYRPALTANYAVWPWVQMANFTLVPLQHRVLAVNVVSIGWNCFLSMVNSGGGGGGTDPEETAEEQLGNKKNR